MGVFQQAMKSRRVAGIPFYSETFPDLFFGVSLVFFFRDWLCLFGVVGNSLSLSTHTTILVIYMHRCVWTFQSSSRYPHLTHFVVVMGKKSGYPPDSGEFLFKLKPACRGNVTWVNLCKHLEDRTTFMTYVWRRDIFPKKSSRERENISIHIPPVPGSWEKHRLKPTDRVGMY